MIGKIKQLPPHEVQKIAAGEVIERPANVVKELVENALDAGARSIKVYIEEGGKKLMRVVDDGCGMSPVDARMSVVHHATSKITCVDDLETVTTFGFRGEALSSISSVSRMTLISKEDSTHEGCMLSFLEGGIVEEKIVAAPTGTDISIADLFYNVPARKKFLKTDDTEWRAINHLMHALALSYPSCGFMVYHNQKLIMQCQAVDDLEQRIPALYDHGHSSLFVQGNWNEPDCYIRVFVGTPQITRYDRTGIYVVVNNRWVKNSKLTHALIKGYDGVLPKSRYPQGIVIITCDSKQVDINIHPRKEEVQFLHPRRIERSIETTVRAALEKHTSSLLVRPSVPMARDSFISSEANKTESRVELTPDKASHYKPSHEIIAKKTLDYTEWHPASADKPSPDKVNHFAQVLSQTFEPARAMAETQQIIMPDRAQELYGTEPETQVENYRLIGQYHKTYILIENEQGLVVVDQHAAHERVLYELFEKRFHEIAIVPLIFPQTFTLHPNDAALLEEHYAHFEHHGITVEPLGPNEYVIKTVPVMLKNVAPEEVVKHVLSSLHDGGSKGQLHHYITHALRAQMACKAAVKAGDELTLDHMHELISSLHASANRLTCPHGRPTLWPITLSEIERTFKRKT